MLLDKILDNFQKYPDRICCKHDKYYSNKEFFEIVRKVYNLIKDAPKDKAIIVYGHKEVYMIASFLACSFLGIAYVPVDVMLGEKRINQIIDIVNPSYILGDLKKDGYMNYTFEDIQKSETCELIQEIRMQKEDLYYIIFTSGSTGTPKGVMITYENVDSCVSWLEKVLAIDNTKDYVIYNQAVFSFDLSVADIYLSLATNSIHYIGTDVNTMNLKEKIDDLEKSNANMLIVTPSTAEVYCLSELFNQNLMPRLEKIVFCGETLSKRLVDELYYRFPNTKIINMYGPTECTYAVTSMFVPKDCEEISIGKPKDDVEIFVVDNKFNIQSEGNVGEILIVGSSVGKGYLNVPSENRFLDYNGKKANLTGDLGFYKNGLLYYVSRKDSQIKYKGYRIELNDIKHCIEKINGIKDVNVIAIKDDKNIVQRIEASILLEDNVSKEFIMTEIKRTLPSYMVPRIKIVSYFDMNINGKK